MEMKPVPIGLVEHDFILKVGNRIVCGLEEFFIVFIMQKEASYVLSILAFLWMGIGSSRSRT